MGEPTEPSSPTTAVYNPKAFIPHAASLGQACAHCRRFSTAATRRCLGSISVPVSGGTLSRPIPVFALVGHYPANKLIGHGHLLGRIHTFDPKMSSGITGSFPPLSQSRGQLTMYYSPFRRFPSPCGDLSRDLHAYSTPPTFILSQDQTLQLMFSYPFAHVTRGASTAAK